MIQRGIEKIRTEVPILVDSAEDEVMLRDAFVKLLQVIGQLKLVPDDQQKSSLFAVFQYLVTSKQDHMAYFQMIKAATYLIDVHLSEATNNAEKMIFIELLDHFHKLLVDSGKTQKELENMESEVKVSYVDPSSEPQVIENAKKINDRVKSPATVTIVPGTPQVFTVSGTNLDGSTHFSSSAPQVTVGEMVAALKNAEPGNIIQPQQPQQQVSKPIYGPLSTYTKSYTEVVELNRHNFDRVIDENEFVFVLFYAPWCARSQSLSKEFDEARRVYKHMDPPIFFARIDCHQNMEVRDRESIGGYPVIMLYRRNGGNVIPRGPTHPDSLAAILRRSTLEHEHLIVDEAGFDDFIKLAPHSFIGLWPNPESPWIHRYNTIIDKLAYRLPIGLIEDPKLIETLTTRYPTITGPEGVLQMVPQEGVFLFNDCTKHNTMGIFRWMTMNRPVVNELTAENILKFASNKKPSIVLFVNYAINTISLADYGKPYSPDLLVLYSLVDQYKDNFNFYYTDGDFYERLGLVRTPSIAVVDQANESHYTYPHEEISKELVQSFLDNLLKSLVEPRTISQPINTGAPNDRYVTAIAHDRFGEIVLNSNIHSLVYFHEPWCGYCKTMNIYYERAAEEITKQFGTKIQVLDFDSSLNSLPKIMKPIVTSYPFISLFSADNPSDPIIYNGTRNIEALLYFVKSNIQKE
eukprot:gene11469-13369_t